MEIQNEVKPDTWGLTADHFPLIIQISSPEVKNGTRLISFRKLKDIDMERFKQDLEESFKTIDFADHDFKHNYLQFEAVSRSVVDEHGPMVNRKQRACEAVWIDVEFKQNRALSRKWNASGKRAGQMEIEVIIWNRRMFVHKTSYYSNLVDDSPNSQKALFKVANELLDKNSEKVLPAYDDPKQLADDFNNFFVQKVDSLFLS